MLRHGKEICHEKGGDEEEADYYSDGAEALSRKIGKDELLRWAAGPAGRVRQGDDEKEADIEEDRYTPTIDVGKWAMMSLSLFGLVFLTRLNREVSRNRY